MNTKLRGGDDSVFQYENRTQFGREIELSKSVRHPIGLALKPTAAFQCSNDQWWL